MRSTKESEAPIAWGEHEDGDSLYNMSIDTYACDICGFEEKWDAHDDRRGDLWECDYCGKHFCTACFIRETGRDAFDKMLGETDYVLCPEHYKEGVFGIEGNR